MTDYTTNLEYCLIALTGCHDSDGGAGTGAQALSSLTVECGRHGDGSFPPSTTCSQSQHTLQLVYSTLQTLIHTYKGLSYTYTLLKHVEECLLHLSSTDV